MHRFTTAILSAIAIGCAGPALAADLTYYPAPPPSGDPLYAPHPIAGDAYVAAGVYSNSNSHSWTMIEGGGRVNIPLHGAWNFEPDLYLYTDSDADSELSAIAHFYKRAPTHVAGFFGGYRSWLDGDSALAFGVEAESYTHPDSIFGGRLHYAGTNYGHAWVQGEVWLHYYFTPNHKITAKADAWAGLNGSASGVEGSLTLTKRFDGTHLSGFVTGEARHVNTGYSNIGAFAGVIWNFDPPGTTQRQHDMMVPFVSPHNL